MFFVTTCTSCPRQAGVANTKWGVEYEPSAAEAFKKNNPEATVFCNNCNVLLRVSDRWMRLDVFSSRWWWLKKHVTLEGDHAQP